MGESMAEKRLDAEDRIWRYFDDIISLKKECSPGDEYKLMVWNDAGAPGLSFFRLEVIAEPHGGFNIHYRQGVFYYFAPL